MPVETLAVPVGISDGRLSGGPAGRATGSCHEAHGVRGGLTDRNTGAVGELLCHVGGFPDLNGERKEAGRLTRLSEGRG